MKIDLHIHTLESDGDFSPEAIVEKAAKAKLKIIAIMDHDAVSGLERAVKSGERLGVRVIPGIEFNCGRFHILGYFIDYNNKDLLEYVAWKEKQLEEQLERTIKTLQHEGFEITVKEVKNFVKCKKIEEKEIAITLAHKGYKQFKTERYKAKDALKLYFWLNPSKDLPIDTDPENAIKIIKKAGGIPIYAHPFSKIKEPKKIETLVKILKQKGIMGIEAYNQKCQTTKETKFLIKLAKKYKLLVSGGTDFHYKKDKLGIEIPNKHLKWVLK
jgi:predicted metal-dependent phosphoesterase TrpH